MGVISSLLSTGPCRELAGLRSPASLQGSWGSSGEALGVQHQRAHYTALQGLRRLARRHPPHPPAFPLLSLCPAGAQAGPSVTQAAAAAPKQPGSSHAQMADTLPTTAPGAGGGPEPPSYAHPLAAFFLMFFKAAAVFIYIFCGWFGTDFVINFCVITFLLVCDFWTVRALGAP